MIRPARDPSPLLQAELRLRKHVDVLAGLIGERNDKHPHGLDAARVYLRRCLTDLCLTPQIHTYKTHTRSAVNIEVRFPGSRPELPPLIVGAHYDTAPGTPGADDNASAVAVLMEIARACSTARLRRPVHCVFYDCEEQPHYSFGTMGSAEHARDLRVANRKILGMICLESVGYFPKRVDPSVQRPRFIRCIDAIMGGQHIVIVSDLKSVGFGLPFVLRFATSGLLRFLPAALPRSLGIIELSDHRSYWDQGYPAVMVTNTAIFRNPNYHEMSDLPDTLDYPRMARLRGS